MARERSLSTQHECSISKDVRRYCKEVAFVIAVCLH